MLDIANSPLFYCGSGHACRSVVLRVQLNPNGTAAKFVVHDKYRYRDMPDSYGHGDYFHGDRMFERALACWQKRISEMAEHFTLAVTQGGKGGEGR